MLLVVVEISVFNILCLLRVGPYLSFIGDFPQRGAEFGKVGNTASPQQIQQKLDTISSM